MKKSVLILMLFGLPFITKSQNASVEKSTYGIQTGVLGAWIHSEIKLSNQIALRTEVGMEAGFLYRRVYSKTNYLMTPVITLEPRWYYNLDNRVSKSKNINGNCGNFLAIQVNYQPNWFLISNFENIVITNQLSIIPTWGIKRNLGKHFTYETGIGIGYGYIFDENIGDSKNVGELDLNLHLRVGYRF